LLTSVWHDAVEKMAPQKINANDTPSFFITAGVSTHSVQFVFFPVSMEKLFGT